ncbi:MAG: hypothetical protein HRJ53_21215 [Acidobacteria bacterium Pan2503]|uniref:Uncharacterized protein n=1 Tax=Candidatus Acidiferrum panamense TaxID=2741543 RepID=A0A7V8NU34_9BACT|nr:hypothetical protein [Candidatus Acidoferrum panamensis]
MATKAEEVEAKLESIRMRTAQLQLEKAEMEMEQTKENVEQWKNEREERSRRNTQRQTQLKSDINERANSARSCTHRQGGSFANLHGGKGPSALTTVILPDERVLIMCSICPMRVFSPFPGDASRKLRRGETKEQMEARVARHQQAMEEFERLAEQARDKLTEEASQAMHCGKTFRFLDADGNQVQVPAPCDSYAQGLDNRKGIRLAN